MKNIILVCFLIITVRVYAQNKSYDYAYVNHKGLCVYLLADKKELLIEKNAIEPALSPDGKKLAYTVSGKNDSKIILIDLNTKVKTILNTRSSLCGHPVWSPDGNFIAYSSSNSGMEKQNICVIGSNNLSPKVLTNRADDFFSPTWLHDGKGIVGQNMHNIFVFDLSGKVMQKYEIPKGVSEANFTSEDIVIFTNDNKKMVFSNYTDEAGGGDGPAKGVFVYDLTKKASIKITPKGYDLYLSFVKDGKAFLIGSKITSQSNNVYSIDLDGKNLKELFANCTEISAKN